MTSSLTKIFISHAGPDWRLASRLAADLRGAGNHIIVDIDDLKVGDDVIRFMNDSIADADFVLILYSQYSAGAINQTAEVNAAIWNEFNQSGAACLILKLDDTDLPPLLGPKLFVDVQQDDEHSYATALEAVVNRLVDADPPTATVVSAFATDGSNPFRRTRAEYFEDDRDLLARTFAPPDRGRLSKLEDTAPCILEGPRGTGKSMLLMSLRARNYLTTHPDRGPNVFGAYLKLSRGALSNVVDLDDTGSRSTMLQETSSQELFVCILESLFAEVQYCLDNGFLSSALDDRTKLSREISSLASFDPPVDTVSDVLGKLASTRRALAAYLRRRFIYDQAIDIPTVGYDADLLAEAILAIKRNIPPLRNYSFAILLDEYENLFPFQQVIINGVAKTAAPRFSIKIARKRSGGYPSTTPVGQELQETHDYSKIDLVYNLNDPSQKSAYLELLRRFSENLIKEELGQKVSLEHLLPSFNDDEVDKTRHRKAIAALCKVGEDQFAEWPTRKRKEKTTYYGTAATYRCLRGRQKKRFAGLDEVALVSSGVIRYFQEILAVGYYLHVERGRVNPSAPIRIPPTLQSEAVHLVSAHNLMSLSRNVQGYGESLRFFLLDLGGCLRHKLLRHTSEPEAGRIALKDPELLATEEMADLQSVLDAGVREGVFEAQDGMPGYFPRHAEDAQPIEYVVCRIFAPVLGISPRARWRTETTCSDLRSLLDRGGRLPAVRSLKARWVREVDDRRQRKLPV